MADLKKTSQRVYESTSYCKIKSRKANKHVHRHINIIYTLLYISLSSHLDVVSAIYLVSFATVRVG